MALALLVGVILIAGSLFRLGWIANLLSTPVTTGFLAGISVHILVSQMPGVLGLPTPSGPMLDRIATLARHVGEANLYTVGIGLGVLAIVAISEKISAKIPGALIGLVAATISGDLGRPRAQGRQRGRHCSGNAADAVISRHFAGAMGQAGAAGFPDRDRRDGADGGDHALVPVRSRQACRCRPRFSRRRRRQRSGGPVRRIPGRRQPAADRHRVRDRRPHATVRAVRRGDHSRAAGVRRHAAAARAECGARRRAAVRGAADHPRQADRHDLSPVDRRILPDRGDRGRDHRAADRTRRRGRHRAVAAARHLDHHPRAARAVRHACPDTTIWWPESPNMAGRAQP